MTHLGLIKWTKQTHRRDLRRLKQTTTPTWIGQIRLGLQRLISAVQSSAWLFRVAFLITFSFILFFFPTVGSRKRDTMTSPFTFSPPHPIAPGLTRPNRIGRSGYRSLTPAARALVGCLPSNASRWLHFFNHIRPAAVWHSFGCIAQHRRWPEWQGFDAWSGQVLPGGKTADLLRRWLTDCRWNGYLICRLLQGSSRPNRGGPRTESRGKAGSDWGDASVQ